MVFRTFAIYKKLFQTVADAFTGRDDCLLVYYKERQLPGDKFWTSVEFLLLRVPFGFIIPTTCTAEMKKYGLPLTVEVLIGNRKLRLENT